MLVAFSSVVYIVIAAAGTFAHKAQFKGYAGHHLDFVRLARRMNCRVKNYDIHTEKLRHTYIHTYCIYILYYTCQGLSCYDHAIKVEFKRGVNVFQCSLILLPLLKGLKMSLKRYHARNVKLR